MMSETGANVQPSEKEPESTNKPPSAEADSKKRAPTPESDDNSAELVCKPQPKKPKTQKKAKVPVTKESVLENCKDGDAYVAKVLGTDKVDASQLLFCIISKGRWANARTVEARLLGGGLPPAQILWLVGTGEREEYEANCSGSVVEGGGLCQSRNRALDEARARKLGCVQMSDDMKRCEIIRCGDSLQQFHDRDTWQKPKDLKAANAQGADKVEITPVAAASLLHALLKATDHRLAGCFPNANPGLAAGAAPVQSHLFIVGDFLVIDVQRTSLRFDERLMLKEDYDYTAQHLHEHGGVCRSNRILCLFEHYDNPGGAVDVRNDEREQHAIQLLHHKWPGAFRQHGTRGPNEVLFKWDQRDVSLGGTKKHKRVDPPAGIDPVAIERKPKGGQRTLTSFFKKKPASTPPLPPASAAKPVETPPPQPGVAPGEGPSSSS